MQGDSAFLSRHSFIADYFLRRATACCDVRAISSRSKANRRRSSLRFYFSLSVSMTGDGRIKAQDGPR
jgi:hypothetical protein